MRSALVLGILAHTAAFSQPVLPKATTAPVSCVVASPVSAQLVGMTVHSSAVGWVMVLDSASVPAPGAVTPREFLRYPTADVSLAYASERPLLFLEGITICFSSTGPYQFTASSTASFSYKVTR